MDFMKSAGFHEIGKYELLRDHQVWVFRKTKDQTCENPVWDVWRYPHLKVHFGSPKGDGLQHQGWVSSLLGS